MAANNQQVSDIYQASSKLAKYPFEPYWPDKKLKICITGAGGFIARYETCIERACEWHSDASHG
jgi:hypothetical protein